MRNKHREPQQIGHIKVVWLQLTFRGKRIAPPGFYDHHPYTHLEPLEPRRKPVSQNTLASCKDFADLPSVLAEVKSVEPTTPVPQGEDMDTPELDEDVLAKSAKSLFGRNGTTEAPEAVEVAEPSPVPEPAAPVVADPPPVVEDEIPDRVGKQWTAKGLAKHYSALSGRTFTIDQVLILDHKEGAELKTKPGDIVSKSRCDKALALESAESEAPPAADSTPGDTNVPEPQPQGDPVETNTAAVDTSSEDATNLNGWVRWLKVLLGELPRENIEDPVEKLDRAAYQDALTRLSGAKHDVYRPFIEFVSIKPVTANGELSHGFLNYDSVFENDYPASIRLVAAEVTEAQAGTSEDLEGFIQKKLGYKSAPVMSWQLEKVYAQAIESVYGISRDDKAYPWVYHALISGTFTVDAMLAELAPKPVAAVPRTSAEDRARAKAEREARQQAQQEAVAAVETAPEPPVETDQSNEVALPEPPALAESADDVAPAEAPPVLFDQEAEDVQDSGPTPEELKASSINGFKAFVAVKLRAHGSDWVDQHRDELIGQARAAGML